MQEMMRHRQRVQVEKRKVKVVNASGTPGPTKKRVKINEKPKSALKKDLTLEECKLNHSEVIPSLPATSVEDLLPPLAKKRSSAKSVDTVMRGSEDCQQTQPRLLNAQ